MQNNHTYREMSIIDSISRISKKSAIEIIKLFFASILFIIGVGLMVITIYETFAFNEKMSESEFNTYLCEKYYFINYDRCK